MAPVDPHDPFTGCFTAGLAVIVMTVFLILIGGTLWYFGITG